MSSSGHPKGRPPKAWVSQVFAERSAPLVAYVASRLHGRIEDAQDVVQEAFVKLCQEAWPDIEPYAIAWLYRTCRNRAIDLLRRERRMSTAGLNDELTRLPDVALQQPDDLAERGEQMQQLQAQIGQLSEQQQEVLRLRLHGGLSYKQIADVTGLTVSNVGFQMHDAISRLRGKLSLSSS